MLMSYPYSITTDKFKDSCNTINNPYVKLCVPDTIKNINVKVFNLMSRTNETRHIEWHKTCKYKCRLNASACNNKQTWNKDRYRCECKELVDKATFDKGFIGNPSNCECECDKSCIVGEYLDYKNFKCRQKIAGELVEEYSKNIDENEMIYNEALDEIPLNDYKNVCGSCTLYIVLFVIFSIIIAVISAFFVYFYWYSRKHNVRIKFNPDTQTAIY